MRRVVTNTGPLSHLQEAGVLDLMSLTGEVHLPPSVAQEIAYLLPSWRSPSWLQVVDALAVPYAEEALTWQQAGLLDAGEAEAIALARQLRADWLLTDDAAARLVAQSLGIEVHGSLGVVLWAAAVGHLDRPRAEAALDGLARSSLWISARVLREARSALDRLCSPGARDPLSRGASHTS